MFIHERKDEHVPGKKRPTQTQSRKKPRTHSKLYDGEIEKLVKVGVERFMLKGATIADFLKTIRSAAKREGVSPHPLTRAVFSRIVKNAIKKHEREEISKRKKQPGRKRA